MCAQSCSESSFPQLFAGAQEPARYLVVDASQPVIVVGVLDKSGWLACHRESGEALAVLFGLVEGAFKQAGCGWMDLAGFLFCRGPGSLLGLRLAAMALSTWRTLPEGRAKRIYQYGSLEAAALQLRDGAVLEDRIEVVSAFRKGRYCALSHERAGNAFGLVSVTSLESLQECNAIWQLQQRKAFAGNLLDCPSVEYSLEHLSAWLRQQRLPCEEVSLPKVFVPEQAEFVKWSGERHR